MSKEKGKTQNKKRKLTRQEKKQIDALIRQSKGDGKPHTAQDSIPFERMYKDGICRLANGRYEHSRKYNEADKKYHNRYPLIEEWGWNRDDCIREIKAAGLPQPGKSSCFFCPSMKKQEILYLKEHYPDLFNRAATLEENAMPYLKTVKGLGRSYSWKEQFGKE